MARRLEKEWSERMEQHERYLFMGVMMLLSRHRLEDMGRCEIEKAFDIAMDVQDRCTHMFHGSGKP